MAVEVFELRLADAPGEIWYGVRVNGRSLEAGWADPDAARRRGEEYARELRSRIGGATMETTERDPDQPEIPEPDEPEGDQPKPEVEREVERVTETEEVTVVEENGDGE